MKKIKTIIKILAVLIVLVILAAIIIPNFIDMRRFTPPVAAIVKEQTGRDIQFNGPIKLSLFPWVKVTAENVALSNAEGFTPAEMLAIGKLSVGVKVLPLLKKQIQIGDVELDGLRLHYAVDQNGVTNIDDILSHLNQASTTEEPPVAESTTDSSPAFDMAKLSIAGIAITDGLLSYDDRQANRKISISPLALTTDSVAMGKPVQISFTTDMTSDNPVFNAKAAINTSITALVNKITLDAIDGRASLISDNSSINADLKANVVYDLTASIVNIDGLSLSSEVKLPDVNEKLMLNTSLMYNIAAGSFELPSIEIGLSDIKAIGSAKGTGLNTTPEITATLATGELKLRNILTKLDMTSLLHDPNTYQSAGLNLNVSLKDNRLNAPFDLSIDDVKLNANITGDLSGAKPKIDVPVTLNGINVDRYLPQSEPAPFAEPAPSTADKTMNIELPQVDLSGLPDINLRFDAGFVEVSGIRVDKINLRSTLQNSTFNMSTLSANLFGGSMAANAAVTGKAATPLDGHASLKLTNIGIANVIKSLDTEANTAGLPKALNLSFNANLKNNFIDISNTELSLDALLAKIAATANLNGRPAVKLDVAVNDVNLDKLLPASSASTASATAETKPKTPAAELPLKTLMNIGMDFTGTLSVKSIIARGISLQNIKTKLAMQNGAVLLSPTTADLYKGTLNADISLKEEDSHINESIKLNIAQVSVDELFKAISKGKPSFLSGKLAANTDLVSSGVKVDDILATLTGDLSYSVTNGVINGVAFDPKTSRITKNNTTIDPIKGSGTFKNGMLSIAPMTVSSEYLGAEIGGGVALKGMGLDMKGNVDVSGLKIPLTVGGAATSPKVSIDQTALAQALVEKYAKDKLKEVLGGGSGGDSPSLKDILGGSQSDEGEKKPNPLGNFLDGLNKR